MVATALGEKLLVESRSVRNWTRRAMTSLFVQKIHLFLGKSTKTAATRAALFDFTVQQIVCRLGLRPRPHWGSLQRSLSRTPDQSYSKNKKVDVFFGGGAQGI